jgi:hypothetical protein
MGKFGEGFIKGFNSAAGAATARGSISGSLTKKKKKPSWDPENEGADYEPGVAEEKPSEERPSLRFEESRPMEIVSTPTRVEAKPKAKPVEKPPQEHMPGVELDIASHRPTRANLELSGPVEVPSATMERVRNLQKAERLAGEADAELRQKISDEVNKGRRKRRLV